MIQPFAGLVPQIDPTAWVHEGAWVIGEVTLGPRASVWPTAVMRGDMGPLVLGADSNLQDGAICHNTGGRSETHIGARVTIGHRAILHGCRVEDDCLIGMGAIVMDNAVIGRGSVVGAGALVLANTVIPPGSLVLGSPAKAVRSTSSKDTEWIAYSWQVYGERARQWLAG